MNKNLLIGILFIIIALGFAIPATQYPIGGFGNPGPGLFPLMISVLLFINGVIALVDSKLQPSETVEIKFKNIAIITVALVCFALATDYINMSVGIVILVAISSFSADTYSIPRVIKISLGLIALAFAFKYLLGLNLPLI